MANWIEVRIRYMTTVAEGSKTVSESYIVDAITCTEAETRVVNEVMPLHPNLNVTAVTKTKVAEIFFDTDTNGDKWYKVKYNITIFDNRPVAQGKPPVEKKISVLTLVQASDIEGALQAFNKGMGGTASDYTIESITETKIVDVYTYKPS